MSFSSVKFVYLFVVFPLLLVGWCEVREKMIAFLLYITSITSWIGSSLSVFALHPLYLRVQALSQNIPEDIKVPFNLPCNMSIYIYMAIHLLNILRVKSTLFFGFPVLILLVHEIAERDLAGERATWWKGNPIFWVCTSLLQSFIRKLLIQHLSLLYTHFRNVHDHFQLLSDSQ